MADYVDGELKKIGIAISKPILATMCIVFGILVILLPTLLVWIVGIFLVFQGALLFTDLVETGRSGTPVQPESLYCSECGAWNGKEAIYCKKCGKQLKLVKHQQLEDYQENTIPVAP